VATRTTCDKCHREIQGTGIWRVFAERRGGHAAMQSSTPLRLEDVCEACVKQMMDPYAREATPRGP
jgi:hypothetical protein